MVPIVPFESMCRSRMKTVIGKYDAVGIRAHVLFEGRQVYAYEVYALLLVKLDAGSL